jgi:hypothetical protein
VILASKLAETDQYFTEIFKKFTEIDGNQGANLLSASDVFGWSLPSSSPVVRRVARCPSGYCDFCAEEGKRRSVADISVKCGLTSGTLVFAGLAAAFVLAGLAAAG